MITRLRDIFCREFRFLIEDNFKVKLFNKALKKEKTIKNLSEKIGCSRDTLSAMKNKRKFIHWKILEKLCELARIPLEDVESKVKAVKGGCTGKIVEIRLPIIPSPELALLVAKGMGDGTIEKDKLRFSFWNKSEKLVKEVKVCVQKAIGTTKEGEKRLKEGRVHLRFTSFIGFVLHLSGAPKGNKTLQNFSIPEWIKNGSKSVKTSFLRGIFDDEASVIWHKRKKEINISMCKEKDKVENLRDFLEEIRQLLAEFNISSSSLREQSEFKDKRGRTKVMVGFAIRGKNNLENFMKHIGFTHPEKQLKLERIIKSFVDRLKLRKAIFEVVKSSSFPLSTSQIARITNSKRGTVLFHLSKLSKEGKVVKKRVKNFNVWFLRSF